MQLINTILSTQQEIIVSSLQGAFRALQRCGIWIFAIRERACGLLSDIESNVQPFSSIANSPIKITVRDFKEHKLNLSEIFDTISIVRLSNENESIHIQYEIEINENDELNNL